MPVPSWWRENLGKSSDRPAELAGGENQPYAFANTAFMTNIINSNSENISNNSLHNSVIYDSGAAGHLTFEKNRFVGDIIPTSEKQWINTPADDLLMIGHGIMLVKGSLNGKPRDLLFPNIAYVPESDVTLISSNILQDKGCF